MQRNAKKIRLWSCAPKKSIFPLVIVNIETVWREVRKHFLARRNGQGRVDLFPNILQTWACRPASFASLLCLWRLPINYSFDTVRTTARLAWTFRLWTLGLLNDWQMGTKAVNVWYFEKSLLSIVYNFKVYLSILFLFHFISFSQKFSLLTVTLWSWMICNCKQLIGLAILYLFDKYFNFIIKCIGADCMHSLSSNMI